MRPPKKIRAGALQFVLFIGVVIAILLLTFVTLSYSHSFFNKKTSLTLKTIKAADLGMAYALRNPIMGSDSLTLDLGFPNDVETRLLKNYWGGFEKYGLVCTSITNRFVKLAMVGGSVTDKRTALILRENERPLIVVGKAKITGDAYLPKQGIRPGNIKGNSYYNSSLIYGRQHASNTQLPKLDNALLNNLESLANRQLPNTDGVQINLKRNGTYLNSFELPIQYVHGDAVTLAEVVLRGNIVIIAAHSITVEASAQLTDVLLVAPEITIKDNVRGTFQAIAGRRIRLGKRCELYYPSALIVKEKISRQKARNSNREPNIFMDSGSVLGGLVLYLGETEEQLSYPQIKIASGAIVNGEVYCEQNLELKGKVNGSVTTGGFMALENGSSYQNHLFNGEINGTVLPWEYSGLIYGNADKKSIGKWLY